MSSTQQEQQVGEAPAVNEGVPATETTTTTTTTQENPDQPQPQQEQQAQQAEAPKVVTEEDINDKFTKARALFKDGKYIEASDMLCDVLEFKVGKYGELAIECAPAYYLYGRSLFLGAAGTLQDKMNEGGDSDDDEEDTEEKKDAEESMEIAWEVLESARIAYEKSGDHLLELSDVYNALYELSAENGQDGIAEAQKCVDLRKQVLPPHSRDISVALALAQYAADKRRESLGNFKKSLETLNGFIASCPEGSPEQTDVQGVLEDLKKTIAEFDFSEIPPVSQAPPSFSNAQTTTTTSSNSSTTGSSSSSSSSAPKPAKPSSRMGPATESTSFAKPTMAAAPENVNFLGMVGRSAKKAATSSSTGTSSTGTSTAAPTTLLTGEKRKGEFEEDAADKKART